LELDHDNSTGLICRKYIRFKIEIDTSLPLASGFDMSCEGEEEPRWIAFLYERLDEYCSYCGLIGHKSGYCPSPAPSTLPAKYKRSLKAPPNGLPCLTSKMPTDDSDSSVSSVASVGNSPSSLVQSQMLDTHGSSQSQLITLRNQMDLAISSLRVFSMQHVEVPHSMVLSQLDSINQNWTYSTPSC
jgi:hypothetical protein